MRTRSALAIAAAAVTVIGAASAIAGVVLHVGAGDRPSVAPIASAPPSHPSAAPSSTPTSALTTIAPKASTRWHYTANGNFSSSGKYLPGALGFNLADVSSVAELKRLPAGVSGLVWLGYCGGATSTFHAMVSPLIGNPKVFGFYMMDEPDPSSCLATNLKAECDWIHTHMPGAQTFALIENRGPTNAPTFADSYTPANSGLDLMGVDPYPVRSDLRSPDYGEIAGYVQAAEAAGWPESSLVPVFQAFGGGNWRGGGTWMLPTPAEEQQIMAIWASVLPAPLFDYAYSWGRQNGDRSLSMSPGLQQVFAAHNE